MGVTVVLAAVLGALVGSFLNVVIHRLPRGESLVHPRSSCPGCRSPIAPRDNVPVFSWVLLGGRCRHCGGAISARYPLVELVTAAVFAAVAGAHGQSPELLVLLPFAAVLIAVAGIDLEHRIVPNKILAPAAVLAVVASALFRPSELPGLLIAGALAFLLLLFAALIYPAGMGMGDVKLAGVMGLYLGVAVAPALFVAFALASVVGLAIVARHGVSARKRSLPFAPFLALGGLVALFVGPALIEVYTEGFLR